MVDVTIDFETRSKSNLKNEGTYKYAADPSTSMLCAAWMVDDGVPSRWAYHNSAPYDLPYLVASPDVLFHAWNAQFEIEIWKNVATPKHGWPECPPLSRWRDTMAESAVAGYPQDLLTTSRLVGKEQKLLSGGDLIELFCKPDKKTGLFNDPSKFQKQFRDFQQYNEYDVRSERSIHNEIKGAMSDNEQRIWEHVVLMNKRGLPIDVETLDKILEQIDKDIAYTGAMVRVLTGGAIDRPTQGKRIIEYLERYGLTIPSLSEEAVNELLDRDDIHPNARRILSFRKLGAGSAIGKFKKIKQLLMPGGTVKGNLRYYGAGPGRHSGLGLQPQNLPRYSHKDPEHVIRLFKECDYETLRLMFPVSKAAKGLIRPIIKAPEGLVFLVNDFKGIEARGVCWLCNEQELIDKIVAGLDVYVVQAAEMFRLAYEDIAAGYKKGDKGFVAMRQAGKICVLACGYAGGYVVFLKEAKKSKFECIEPEAKQYVAAFRKSRPKVTAAWKAFETASIEAMAKPGDVILVDKIRVTFQLYRGSLRMLLPSGRYIYYPQATMSMQYDRFGQMKNTVFSGWINSTTHKWEIREMSGPLFFQNAIQGLCRDLLVNAQVKLEEAGYPQIGSVHDEAIGMSPEYLGHTLEGMSKIMLEVPEWAKGFPMGASGFVGKRYKKD